MCVYIDDILVTGTSEEEHLKNSSEVLQRLENAGLCLKKDKCSFMLPDICKGLRAYTDEKISAIS